ncbi:hypothetical protein [Natroniella sp. ANB-PHB2]|uniref:hypothetical protein n=1 Tax=Natroniella sp. ANB-PHB2 TaxID=3384444 RepID=UPI0038D4170F
MVRLKVCEIMYEDIDGNIIVEMVLKPLTFWSGWTEEEIRKLNFLRHQLGTPGEQGGTCKWSIQNYLSAQKLSLKMDQEISIAKLYELVQEKAVSKN